MSANNNAAKHEETNSAMPRSSLSPARAPRSRSPESKSVDSSIPSSYLPGLRPKRKQTSTHTSDSLVASLEITDPCEGDCEAPINEIQQNVSAAGQNELEPQQSETPPLPDQPSTTVIRLSSSFVNLTNDEIIGTAPITDPSPSVPTTIRRQLDSPSPLQTRSHINIVQPQRSQLLPPTINDAASSPASAWSLFTSSKVGYHAGEPQSTVQRC